MDRAELALHKPEIESLVKAFAGDQFAICARCILRYCNAKQVFTCCSYDQVVADLISLLSPDVASAIGTKLSSFCSSCFNVLADNFSVEKSAQIYAKVKEDGFNEVKSFQLQIHLPVVLTLRDSYFQKKFSLQNDEIISIKELFKVFLVAKLNNLLKAELNGDSNFVIGK